MKYGILSLASVAVVVGVYGLFFYDSKESTKGEAAETKISEITIETSSTTEGDETANEAVAQEDKGETVVENEKEYQNESYGYSFTYPKLAKLTEFTDEMQLVEGANSGGLVDVAVVTNEFKDVENISALVYVEARLRCDADGPEGSVRCGEVVESEEYVSEMGAVGEKFTLEKTETTTAGEEKVSTYGPIYFFPISKNVEDASLGAVLIAPPLGAEDKSGELLDLVVSSLQI